MFTLDWDPTLAYLAEFNVRKCSMAHDACFKTKNFTYPGQNLYFGAQTIQYPDVKKAVNDAIQAWYSEYKFASQSHLSLLRNVVTKL